MNERVEKARLIKREERQEYRRREQRRPMIQSESRARRAADDVVRGWIESRREQKASAHASFAALFAD